MKHTNWYVITGAPSSGKTTLINQLAAAQFTIAPEVARQYIEQLLANHFSLAEIRQNNRQLQRQILALVLKRERHIQPEQPIFFDRGTPDSLGYFHYYQLDPHHIVQTCQRTRYKKIFFCHPLCLEYDTVRLENNLSAAQIGKLIYQSYLDLGYQLIELPAVSVEQRMDIILTHLDADLK